MTSLPIPNISKTSTKNIKVFFDRYYTTPVNLSDDEISSSIAFFESKGFEKSAALAVSIMLINQAKNDKVTLFTLLDSLRKLSEIQLNELVAEILNYNRRNSSVVGFKKPLIRKTFESRNIIETALETVVINTSTENNFSSTGFTFDSSGITWDGE